MMISHFTSQKGVALHIMDLSPPNDFSWLPRCFLPSVLETLAFYPSARRFELLAGRFCARQALSQLSMTVPWVPTGPHRAPIWPKGVVGSITHTNDFVAALAARTEYVQTAGIDAEPIMVSEVARSIASMVVAPGELESLRDQWVPYTDEQTVLTLLYSAKESLFKCLYPFVGDYFDFNAAQVGQIRWEEGVIELSLRSALTDRLREGWSCVGHFEIYSGRVHTAILIPRSGDS